MAASFLVLAASGGGCGEDPEGGGDPHITLLLPEPGERASQYLGVAGETSGFVQEVAVQVDGGTEIIATRDGDTWFLVLDASTIPDGSHTVTATARGSGDKSETTPARRFVSVANAPAGTIVIEGGVNDLTSQEPLPGATVSILDGTRSTIADATGAYALTGNAPGQVVIVKGSAPGYWSTNMFRLAQTDDTDDINIPLASEAAVQFIAGEYGVAQDPGKAVVIGFLVEGAGAVEGATVGIQPVSGDGPFYLGDGIDPFDPTLTATSSRGQFVFFNVDAGPVDFTAVSGTSNFFTVGSAARAGSLSLVAGFVIP